MLSLQKRLGLGLLLSLLLLLALFWWVVSSSIRSLAEDHIASRLQHDSETLLAQITIDTDGWPVLDASPMTLVYSRPFSGHYFMIRAQGQTLRSRSLWDHELALQPLAIGEEQRRLVSGPRAQPLLMHSKAYEKAGQVITIAVAEDMSQIEADIGRFQRRFAITAGVLLLILVIVQVVIIRQGLRPLKRVRDEIGRLERGEQARLTEQVPGEIRPLITEVNRLLDVMNQRLQRSRHALGDLAHALKKPLTVLTQLADDEMVRSNPELQAGLTRQTQAMQQTTDHILKRARLAGEGPAGLLFDPEQEIHALIGTLKKMHQDKGCVIDVEIPAGLRLNMDREDLLELLGNLLDNAYKWAKENIRLQIVVDPPGAQIEVEDDGPGIADDQLEVLSQRGARLDEQVAGHGLGLAIVRDILALYGGQVLFSRSEGLGGLKVLVKLP